MSLDTALTNQQEQRTEIGNGSNGNGLKKRSSLRYGPCPCYDSCYSPSKSQNYYCLQSRQGLIFQGKVVCYKSKEQS